MTEKIKIAYDWLGPTGPISNTISPNLYDFVSVIGSDVSIHNNKKHLGPSTYYNIYKKFPEIFDVVPSFTTDYDDLFIYEYQMYHWVEHERLFSYDDLPGFIEMSNISHKTLDNIRNGRGYILIENMFEATVYDAFFERMHSYFEKYNIPHKKIIYQVGCANAEEIYNAYCARHNIPENNRMKVVFWDQIEWNLSLTLKNISPRSYNKNLKSIKKTFLVFNRRYRTHRTKLTLLFKKFGLLEDSWYSMPATNVDGRENNTFMHQVDWNFAQKIGISREEVEQLYSILPLRVDNITKLNDMIDVTSRNVQHLYDSSLITVVTETFFETQVISVTEKSFKPLFYKQPFIIVGAPHSLHYLKKKGYKTFSNWFDESYDEILDHDNRIIKIAEVCKTISEWSQETKQKFIEETQEILEHNYNLFCDRSNSLEGSFWLNLEN
jgi:hypothetical protein